MIYMEILQTRMRWAKKYNLESEINYINLKFPYTSITYNTQLTKLIKFLYKKDPQNISRYKEKLILLNGSILDEITQIINEKKNFDFYIFLEGPLTLESIYNQFDEDWVLCKNFNRNHFKEIYSNLTPKIKEFIKLMGPVSDNKFYYFKQLIINNNYKLTDRQLKILIESKYLNVKNFNIGIIKNIINKIKENLDIEEYFYTAAAKKDVFYFLRDKYYVIENKSYGPLFFKKERSLINNNIICGFIHNLATEQELIGYYNFDTGMLSSLVIDEYEQLKNLSNEAIFTYINLKYNN